MDSSGSVRTGYFRCGRAAIIVALGLTLLEAVGCGALRQMAGYGPKLEVGYEDPSFTPTDMLKRPVAVGGFAWSAGPVEREPEVCAVLEAVLWERLSEDIGAERMKAVGWVSQALDSADRARDLESFDKTGRIDSLGSERLTAAFRDSAALIVFGRVLEDKIETTTDYATSDKDQTTENTTRKVRIALVVFDPSRGSDVWRAEVFDDKTESETVDDDFNLGGALAGLALGALANTVLGGWDEQGPPPVLASSPDLTEVVWDLCGELGKTLAGKRGR